MDRTVAFMLFILGVCLFILVMKYVWLRLTKCRLLREELPFTVFATVRTADEAEYVVRCAMDRVKWLDLHGMCRIVCLNPSNDPEIDAILRRLVQIYPFAQIGSLQTRKNVL
ncbi:MAG: hypothetical protein J6C51_06970 [Clostridia bacterium]|nr:hypothetical protein [Clostridia bacterium]